LTMTYSLSWSDGCYARRSGGRRRWAVPVAGALVVVALDDTHALPRMRGAVWGALGYAVVTPILQVALLAESTDGGATRAIWALVGTVAFLPLYCWHVLYAADGRRPPWGVATLAAMAAIIIGILPLAGPSWLPMFAALVVSCVIVLPLRLALPISAVTIALQSPLAVALHSTEPAPPTYYVLTVAWRSAATFVPIWLVGAISQLNAVRARLAHDAVVRERLAIDAELRSTVGAALASIAERGEKAAALLREDPAAVPHSLRQLVDGARAAGADARALIGRYHRGSVRAELDTAAALLAAAGIRIEMDLPADLPSEGDAAFRAELHSATTRLLRRDSHGPFVLTVRRDGDRLHVQVHRAESAVPR
ncbi:MAG TPA: hypothetical protein VGJ28_01470, partial [Micromonosporaceae bacterium]